MRDGTSFELALDYPLDKNDEILDYELELYFFPPSTLSATSSWKNRARFYRNLKSNFRWHTPEETTDIFKFKKSIHYLSLGEEIASKDKLVDTVISENKLFARIVARILAQIFIRNIYTL